jgi:AraC-like DNA-binding protein
VSLALVSADAHPRLRRFVTRYHGYAEHSSGPVVRDEGPHSGVTVIVNLGPPLTVDGTTVSSFAAGLYTRPAITAHLGEQAGLQLYVAPPAARMLLGLPLVELAHRAVDLEDLLGAGARELPERLAGLPDWPARFALMDAVVARRLAVAAPPPSAVLHAWSRIVATGGRVRVGELSAETGLSARHLGARFRDELGLPPKQYARVVRFERAAAALRADPRTPLAALAAGAGFADQAHLTREFRALGDTTPAAFANVQDATPAAA